MSKKWTNIARVIDAPAIESSSDGVYLTEEQMDALDASVSSPEQTQLAADLSAANASLEAANATIANLQTEVASLRRKPGATAEVPHTTTDVISSTENKKQVREMSMIERDLAAQAEIRQHDWTKPLEEE